MSQHSFSESHHRKLSEELNDLSAAFKDRAVKMGEMIGVSHGRGQLLMLIFLNIPFISPLPLPGLSTPLGMIVMFLGIRVGLGRKPWLPKRLMEWTLPPHFFPLLLKAAGKVLKFFEFFLKPRFEFMGDSWIRFICGLSIFIAGALLMLPLPIPLTNGLPAWAIIFMAAGMIECDGLFILAGLILFVVCVAYFVFLGMAGAYAIEHIVQWLMFWRRA